MNVPLEAFGGPRTGPRRRLALLAGILVIVTVVVGGVTFLGLYRTAFDQQCRRLVESARSQARVIESVARFEEDHDHEPPGDRLGLTLDHIREAHERFEGFGRTGEYALALRRADSIVFVLSHRHVDVETPEAIPWESHLAEPMRQALRGESGTLVGLDYRGQRVLAAFEPVAELDLGIVAKIDLAEVRAPFVRMGLIVAGVGAVVIVLGMLLFRFEAEPLITDLADSERKYRTLFEDSRDAIVVTAPSGAILDVNPATVELYGYDRDELARMNARELYADPADRDRFRREIEARGSVKDFEVMLRHKDGRRLHCLISSTVERAPDGTVIAYRGAARDVTARRTMERALRESEERFRNLVETSQDLICCCDVEARFTYLNPAWERALGYALDELLGRPFTALQAPQTAARDMELFRARLADGQPLTGFETTLRTKSGETRYLTLNTIPIRAAEGEIVGIQGSAYDITERKRAEAERQQAVERYRTLVRASFEGVALHDGTRILDANRRFAEMFGYAHADVIGMRALAFAARESRPSLARNVPVDLDAPREITGLRADGTTFPLEMVAKVVEHEGRPTEVAAVRDISARKQMEEALRASEAKNRALLTAFPDMMFHLAADGTYLEFIPSPALEPLVPPAQFLGKRVPDVMPEPLATRIMEDVARTLETGETQTYEYDVTIKGSLRAYEYRMVTCGPRDVLGIVRDITERKRADEALRESEGRLRRAQRVAGMGFLSWNLATNGIAWSDEVYDLYGVDRTEPVTIDLTLQLVHPDDLPRVRERLERAVQETEPYDLDHRIVRPDGDVIWVHARADLQRDETSPDGILLGVVIDITERKRAEEALRASRERLRNLTARLQAVREEERIGIARELHDELGQALTGLEMDISWVREKLPKRRTELQARIRAAGALLESTVDSVRRISARLRPPMLDDLGLEAAVEWAVDEFAQRTGITCNLSSTLDEPRLAPQRATAIFRILQEALTNVARHSAAHRVDVRLAADNGQVSLQVDDDGRGIPKNALAAATSLGLVGMRERAGALGGRVTVGPRDAGGTRVVLTMPRIDVDDA